MCEGWHNKLVRCMGTIQQNVFKFTEGILNEQKETELILSRIEAGKDPAPRRPKYEANDQRLIKIVKRFSEAIFEDSFVSVIFDF